MQDEKMMISNINYFDTITLQSFSSQQVAWTQISECKRLYVK